MANFNVTKATQGPTSVPVGSAITSSLRLARSDSFYSATWSNPTSMNGLVEVVASVAPGQSTGEVPGILFSNAGATAGLAVTLNVSGSELSLRSFVGGTMAGGSSNDFTFTVYDGPDNSAPVLTTAGAADVVSGITVSPTGSQVWIEIEATSPDIFLHRLIVQEEGAPFSGNLSDPVPVTPAGTTRTWEVTQSDDLAIPVGTSGTGDIALSPSLELGQQINISVTDTVTTEGVYQNTASVSGPDVTGGVNNAQGQQITVTQQAETGGNGVRISCAPACAPNAPQSLPVAPPCATCEDGTGTGGGADVEQLVLCDVDANGEIIGTALAVYEYDTDGNPVGAPTFVNPATGDPYEPQGILQPCPEATTCPQPLSFCFTSTSTGPVDHPGRVYDIELPINPGFAVNSLQIGDVTHAANIEWRVTDPDGEQFRQDLRSFIAARFSGATVTVTNPNAGTPVCGEAQPMQVNIQCLRIDQGAPDLVELIYNGGRDLVVNAPYNTTPPTNLQAGQFHYLSRQDNGGTIDCTGAAGRGWETNDVGGNFEIWSEGPGGLTTIQNVTPTPRGTPVQEIAADFSGNPDEPRPTIWQTFNVPAAGTLRAQMVHGARDAGEVHTIRLSTGDVDDEGSGDIINNVSTPAQVTNAGAQAPGAWRNFQQDVALAAGTYTFSLSTTMPVGNNRGGLFTDMRVFVDAPNQRAAAAIDDDTCVVTVEETTTTTDCQYWAPNCVNGDVVSWRNIETGEVLSNAAFWGQVPAPSCCLPEASTSTGGGGVGNLVHNYEVCGLVNGLMQTLNRVVITDQSGGAIAQTFIGPDGGPVTPAAGWTVGACAAPLPPDCCQPELICIHQSSPQTLRFVSNADHADDGEIDEVWSWISESNGLPANDPNFGPQPGAPEWPMYRPTSYPTTRWNMVDTDTDNPAWWVTPHPTSSTVSSGLDGEGPTIGTQRWWARVAFDIPENADPSTIQVRVTVLNGDQYVERWRANNGAWNDTLIDNPSGPDGACPFAPPNAEGCTPYTFGPSLVSGLGAGSNTLTVQINETVGGTGSAGVMLHMEVSYELVRPLQRTWTRKICCDDTIYYLDEDGVRHDELPEDWEVAPCTESQYEGKVLCDATGAQFLRVYGYGQDGTVTVQDFTLTGGQFQAVEPVGGCEEPPVPPATFQTTVQDVTGIMLNILPAGDLVSWSVRNRDSTTATVQVNGGAVLPIDPAETIASGEVNEDGGILNDTVVIDPGSGTVRVMMVRRV